MRALRFGSVRAILGASLVLVTSQSFASEIYPPAIRARFNAQAEPPCTICHATLAGGNGTARQPFAEYLRSRGLAGESESSLKNALDAMVAERHDTDGDGKTDEDELKAGENPNGNVSSSVPPIEYGCGGRIAPKAPIDGVSFGAAIGVMLALVTRRRRK